MTIDSNTNAEYERIMEIVKHEKETGELPDWVTNTEEDQSSVNEPEPPAKSATGTNKCGKRHKAGPQRRAPVRACH